MNFDNVTKTMVKEIHESFPCTIFRNKEIYAQWLAQTYFFVCHSTPLLGYSLPFLKTKELKHHFEHHLGEEKSHELLALKDIQKLDRKIEEFSESSATQAFYQGQFYRIAFEGGTSLLGYILYLEMMAVHWGQGIYEEVKKYHPQSVLFIKLHAEEDPSHVENAKRAIQALSPQEQEVIMRNLHYSHEMYMQMLSTVVASAGNKDLKAA